MTQSTYKSFLEAMAILKVRDQRIAELEAALRARGHTDICVTRVRGKFPCDCGLDAALAPKEHEHGKG